jgi:hypothetical protein
MRAQTDAQPAANLPRHRQLRHRKVGRVREVLRLHDLERPQAHLVRGPELATRVLATRR